MGTITKQACIALMVLLVPAVRAGQPTWITMQNENFRVYSTASERATRQLLDQFERVRGFFVQFSGIAPEKSTPVNVVIFGTAKEYQPYRLNAFATAYYSNQFDRDFIVVGQPGEGSAGTASHEYTHLVFAHAGFTLPPWLGEGMAELYATLAPLGKDTVFGGILPGRLQALNQDAWVPLATILAADHDSPYYNETRQAGSLYNESWALVHMLATTDEYRSKFWDVVRAINGGADSVKALEAAYGVPLASIETALKSYVGRQTFNQLRVKIALEGVETLASQPADLLDVREVQAELLMGLQGRRDEARERLVELTRLDATRPAPWANLGYLAWREGRTSEAIDDFARAYELGDRSPRLLYDFGGLAARSKPEVASAALTQLLAFQPDNLDARLMLANLQMAQDRAAEAVETVRAVQFVRTAEQRDRLLYLRAVAALRLGDVKTARARAAELEQATSSDEFRSRAADLLRMLKPR